MKKNGNRKRTADKKKRRSDSATRFSLDECDAKTEVDAQALGRAVELLARWALQRGRKG